MFESADEDIAVCSRGFTVRIERRVVRVGYNVRHSVDFVSSFDGFEIQGL